MSETKQPNSSGNLTSQTFSGFIWMISGSGVQVVLKIGVLGVLARLVTPKEFGLMGIAIMVVEFSKMFTHMGVGPALVQRDHLEPRHLQTGFTLSLLMGITFGAILLLVAPFLAAFFNMADLTKILRVISLLFLIDSFSLIAESLMQRNMRFKLLSFYGVLSYTAGYGAVGIFLAYQGMGVWALVGASLAQACLYTAMLLHKQTFPKKIKLDKISVKELIFFGGGFTIAKFGNYFATQGDNLVIGKTLGAAALGVYGRAYQFMVMPAGLFGNALDKALFPAMAKVQGDKEKVGKSYLIGVSLIALVAIPISITIVILAKEIVMVVLGPSWTAVIIPLQILGGSLLFRMGYKISDTLSKAIGAVYKRAWRQFIYAGLVVVGSLFGQRWGLVGVAWGVSFALVVNFILMAHLSLSLTRLQWSDLIKVHGRGLLLGVITGLACWAIISICRYHEVADVISLLLTTAGIGISDFIFLYFFHRLIFSKELKELFKNLVLKRLKKADND